MRDGFNYTSAFGEEIPYLNVTQFETVKGENFKERSISKFLKMLCKRVNQSYTKTDINMNISLLYRAKIYKFENNIYEIDLFNDYLRNVTTRYDKYYIDCTKRPELGKELTKLAEITRKHDYEKECYDKLEKDDFGTTNENKAFLNYLRRAKAVFDKLVVKRIALILGLPIHVVIAFLCYKYGLKGECVTAGVLSFVYLIGNIMKMAAADIEGTSLWKNVHLRSLLKKRVKYLEEKLNYTKKNNGEESIKVEDNKDRYKDGVFNYVHCIRQAIPKLEKTQQQAYYNQLLDIVMDYSAKMKKYNDGDIGLTLNNNEHMIKEDAVKKLCTLQMEIADLIEHRSTNEQLLSESADLQRELELALSTFSNEEVKDNGGVAVVTKKRKKG